MEEFNFATPLNEETSLNQLRPDSFEAEIFEPTQPPHILQEKETKPNRTFNQSNYQHFSPLMCPFEGNSNSFVTNSQISMMIPTPNGIISRSNSQPDLTMNLERISQPSNNYYFSGMNHSNMNTGIKSGYSSNVNSNGYLINGLLPTSSHGKKMSPFRRHPSLSYKTSMSECNEQEEDYLANFSVNDYLSEISRSNCNIVNSLPKSKNLNSNLDSLRFNTNSLNMSPSCSTTSGISSLATGSGDDGILLGTDAYTDFLTSDVTFSGPILTEEIPILEDLMSLKFELSPSNTLPIKQTQCDLHLPDKTITSNIDCNAFSNYFDYCHADSSMTPMNGGNNEETEIIERTTKSAPPSPTPQKKKQRPAGPIMWNKAW